MSACRVHSGAPGFAAAERLNAYRGLTHAYQNACGDNELILYDTARAMADRDRYDTARAMADRDRYVPPEPGAGPPDGGDLDSPRVWLFLARDTERRMRDRLAARVDAALRRATRSPPGTPTSSWPPGPRRRAPTGSSWRSAPPPWTRAQTSSGRCCGCTR